MFVIESRGRTEHVNNFRPVRQIKADSFSKAEKTLMCSIPNLVRRSAKAKPGKRIDHLSYSDNHNIYRMRKAD